MATQTATPSPSETALETFQEYVQRKGGSLSIFNPTDQDAFTRRDVQYFLDRDHRDGAMARQAQAIQAENNKRCPPCPTLGELEEQIAKIDEQVAYWTTVDEDAVDQFNALRDRQDAANAVIESIKGVERPTREERRDREDAMSTLDSVEPKLERAERRLKNAALQLNVWNERRDEFPHALLRKLRADERSRLQVKGKLGGKRSAAKREQEIATLRRQLYAEGLKQKGRKHVL